MAGMLNNFLAELDQEAGTTRRVLERVPETKLAWKPHPKSMSLGQLALHVATIPGAVAQVLANDSYDITQFVPPTAQSAGELMSAFEESLRTAKGLLGSWDDQKATGIWKLTKAGKEIFVAPRMTLVRAMLLNHWVHHRGQLSVYLRLLEVPVPSIYGPSADENPFDA